MTSTKDALNFSCNKIPASAFKAENNPLHNSNNKGKRIGILVVAYNAVTTLASVLNRIPADVWNNVEEVAVFDDYSKDETHIIGVGYKTLLGIDKLKVLKNNKNLGYGGNQKLGYNYFIEKGFDVVVLLHGDGQYAPEILANMYAPIVNEQADAVFGSRMMKDFGGAIKGGMPLYKFIGNKILTTVENFLLGMSLTEFHSGYRAYNVHMLKHIDMSKMTNDFHFDTEIIIKLNHQKYRIKEVPIPTFYGDEICYVNGMKYAGNICRALFRYKRTINGAKVYPEFAEYNLRSPSKTSKNSSHHYFLKFIGDDKEVLDIGCGEGYFASEISNQNNRITGVDTLTNPQCFDAFKHYICTDLDKSTEQPISTLVKEQAFDRILLFDKLEHLRFGNFLLNDCKNLLKKDGLLLISIPNAANITVRFSLLMKSFCHRERGILDKTRLRFYTQATVKKFLEENGYEIVEHTMTTMPIELALGISSENYFMRISHKILSIITKIMPGLFGYQCLFAARVKH